MKRPQIVVVGSVNLDMTAHVAKLPVTGETVTGATLRRYPGGKGANQALAARRLGAEVSLVACVGDDANADDALALLRDGGVDLAHCRVCDSSPTGVALICVDAQGENQIVVAPGANRALQPGDITLPAADALVCQLEVPADTLTELAARYEGLFCINLAPAMAVPGSLLERADVIVVNETESDFYGESLVSLDAMIVRTFGARGAEAYRNGTRLARSDSFNIDVVDTTGAGDTFTAALVVRLASGDDIETALRFACAAGALATTRAGAQPSLPSGDEVNTFLAEN